LLIKLQLIFKTVNNFCSKYGIDIHNSKELTIRLEIKGITLAMPDSQLSVEILSVYSGDLISRSESAQALLDECNQIPQLAPRLAESGPAPAGTKAVVETLPQVLLSMGAAGALLPAAVNLVKDWLVRQPKNTEIKLKSGDIEVVWSGTTPPEQLSQALDAMLLKLSA
jgi:hypothetical protein